MARPAAAVGAENNPLAAGAKNGLVRKGAAPCARIACLAVLKMDVRMPPVTNPRAASNDGAAVQLCANRVNIESTRMNIINSNIYVILILDHLATGTQ